jgi:acetylornithine deacetylase/succinyl-diaminopimelate desuccinylase-like protein
LSFIDDNFTREVTFLKELVKVPLDNPPGDTARHGERSAELYEGIGFKVEKHKVPEKLVNQYGMKTVTNLVIRETFGSGKGPVIALNAHGDVVPPG